MREGDGSAAAAAAAAASRPFACHLVGRCYAPACPTQTLPMHAVAPLAGLQGSVASPQQYLQALQELLVQYDVTLPAATLFRPVLLKAVAGLVEAAIGSRRGGTGRGGAVQPGPELAVALLSVLELAPHTEGCAGVLGPMLAAPA